MLLTITCFGENAFDLGYLLHKHPGRPQIFELNFGKAYVFYPEVTASSCTAALLLDIDPLNLARGKPDAKSGGIFDYVNDRPYVSSSFISVAISRVFGAAMNGRCEERKEAALSKLDLMANLTMLPCRGNTKMLNAVFEPLGYTVEFSQCLLDEKFPEWGRSPYVNLILRGRVRLQDLLRHLYVLIPVFDHRKHYWISDDEVDKLINHGEGWLPDHPQKEFIAGRYFNKLRHFTRIALNRLSLDRLDNGEGPGQDAEEAGIEIVPSINLNTLRLEAVFTAIRESGARSVLDLGCGEGNLLKLLLNNKNLVKIAGADVSAAVLEYAADKLNLDRMTESQRARIDLFQASLCYRDKRFLGFDVIALVEVIEHIDENRLNALAENILGEARPKTIIITTPNREYNRHYPLAAGSLRHSDHRFEWTRAEFRLWAEKIAGQFGYQVGFEGIGNPDTETGTPTQMGIFQLCG
ncbi:MAG: 3' terminal RNA ribose 2'-O-methyltransferase Hen1 [Treponema sp.]|jgi:3' terminal RNA ribose 2'-O-methyltransferase Hen1|nr:3' terminal RNA ribose 2'-O-methyltransferase Hen1 [Treponema sp.]